MFFLPRAKVILAPRCRLSDPTCWPSSLTSPAGPRCISVSASCWARTGSRGEHPHPPRTLAGSWRQHPGALWASDPAFPSLAPWRGFLQWLSPPWGYRAHLVQVTLLWATTSSSDGVRGCCPHCMQGSQMPTLCGQWARRAGGASVGFAGVRWGRQEGRGSAAHVLEQLTWPYLES